MDSTTESPFSLNWHRFLDSWGLEVQAKLDRVSQLIGDVHRPSEGSYREILFRQLLRRVLPSSYRVSTGFIVGWGNRASPQLDVIVWDASRSAPLLEEGEFAIVTDDAAEAIIEVKTTLTSTNLKKSLAALHPANYRYWRFGRDPQYVKGLTRQVPNVPIRGVVGFRVGQGLKSNPVQRCFEELKDFYQEQYGADLPDMLSQGATGGRCPNLLDVICLGPTCTIEQGQLSAIDSTGNLVPGSIGFGAFDFKKEGFSTLALARFCLYVAHLLGNRVGPKTSAPRLMMASEFPFATPAVLALLPIPVQPTGFKWWGRDLDAGHVVHTTVAKSQQMNSDRSCRRRLPSGRLPIG